MNSTEDEDVVVQALEKLDPRNLPRRVFHAIERVAALTAIETVFLREREETIEVFLLERPADDPYYGGQMHSPGSMLRGGDIPHAEPFGEGPLAADDLCRSGLTKETRIYEWPFRRILRRELNARFRTSPQFVRTFLYPTLRGLEHVVAFLCAFEEEPQRGEWRDVLNLPPNLISHHFFLIGKVVEYFRAHNT